MQTSQIKRSRLQKRTTLTKCETGRKGAKKMATHPYSDWNCKADVLGAQEGWPLADSDASPYQRSRSHQQPEGGATPATHHHALIQPEREKKVP